LLRPAGACWRNEHIGGRPVLRLTTRQRWTCYAAAIVAYFIAAHWLKISHVPAVSQVVSNIPGEKVRLLPPYEGFLDSGFAVIAVDRVFGGVADSIDNAWRSTILIYEDDRRLGPAHSNHADVGSVGRGRFSHYRNKNSIFLFSSSDNTDPRTNRRAYWAIKPDVVEPPQEP
jgi:hypothetical protein